MSEAEQNDRIREWFKKTTGLKSDYLRVHMNEIESKLKESEQQNKELKCKHEGRKTATELVEYCEDCKRILYHP